MLSTASSLEIVTKRNLVISCLVGGIVLFIGPAIFLAFEVPESLSATSFVVFCLALVNVISLIQNRNKLAFGVFSVLGVSGFFAFGFSFLAKQVFNYVINDWSSVFVWSGAFGFFLILAMTLIVFVVSRLEQEQEIDM